MPAEYNVITKGEPRKLTFWKGIRASDRKISVVPVVDPDMRDATVHVEIIRILRRKLNPN